MSIPQLDSRPAQAAFAVTPHDSTNFTTAARGIYVGVSGNVVAVMLNGDVVTFVGLAAGVIHPIACVRINSTSTDATSIVGVY